MACTETQKRRRRRQPPGDVSTWTSDYCANMAMVRMIIAPHHVYHIDGATLDPSGDFISIDGARLYVGDEYPVSLHLVRAVEYVEDIRAVPFDNGEYYDDRTPPHVVYGEACRFHLGRFATGWGEHGEEVPWLCSEPVERSSADRRVHFGQPFIFEEGRQSQLPLQPGDEYILAAYRTPVWHEASYYSRPCICAIPV